MIINDNLSLLPFEHRVDVLVLDSIAREMSGFHELLRSLPGIFPSAVLASIRRLSKSHKITNQLRTAFEQEAKNRIESHSYDKSLPPPHPLNFEWRFTRDTALNLLQIAISDSRPGEDILLFGTPGVARVSLRAGVPNPLTFHGEDNAVTDILKHESRKANSQLRISTCGEELENNFADAVVIDPPWYQDYNLGMLKSASNACKLGGKIHLAMAPIGTNRSVFQQREIVLKLASELGLKLEVVRTNYLQYETPYFEANAMRAAGLAPIPVWRNADLATFSKTAVGSHTNTPSCVSSSDWEEVTIGRMRLFVNTKTRRENQTFNPFQRVHEGDVLPSVSRHDPRRKSANVWTSGNRIFNSTCPDLIIWAARIELAELDQSPLGRSTGPSQIEIDELLRIKYVLSCIAQREADEEASLFKEIQDCTGTLITPRSSSVSNITKLGGVMSTTSNTVPITQPSISPFSQSHTCRTSSMG